MNLDPSLAMQAAVYNALIAQGLTVYDRVPDNPSFPFAHIGDDTVELGDNNYQYSATRDIHINVHAFSQAMGKMEIKTISQKIVAALEVILEPAGFRVLDNEPEQYRFFQDVDTSANLVTEHFLYEIKYCVSAT